MIELRKHGQNNFEIVVELPGPVKEREIHILLEMGVKEFHELPLINMYATGELLPEGIPLLIEALQLAQNIVSGKIIVK